VLKLKPKICKCGKKALPNRKICWTCECAKRKEKRLKAQAKQRRIALKTRQIELRAKKRDRTVNSVKYLKKRAWVIFSRYIRQKGMNSYGMNQCYICGAFKHWKEMHACHFFHGRLDFSEDNIHVGCPQCNTFKSGNLAPYAIRLVDELGEERFKALKREAETTTYTADNLKEIIAKYSPLIVEEG
jgi:hypothetical protein